MQTNADYLESCVLKEMQVNDEGTTHVIYTQISISEFPRGPQPFQTR
jgi:hypothetical protein